MVKKDDIQRESLGMDKSKIILDACCGGRCFWFNKKHPYTLYIDNRVAHKGHCPHRENHSVEPDIVMDNTNMDFPDNRFKLIVFDPPHMVCGKTGWQWAKYGAINKETWAEDLKKSFDECWRVLDDYGVLIFKWNETSVKRKEVLEAIGRQPLFGHPTNSKCTTHWFTFMKIPGYSHNLKTKKCKNFIEGTLKEFTESRITGHECIGDCPDCSQNLNKTNVHHDVRNKAETAECNVQ